MKKILILTILGTMLIGCSNKTQTGALIGGGTGALVGGAIGHNAGGAILGGAVGAGVGALVGHELEK